MLPGWLGRCSLGAIALAVAACGTDAAGVQACRDVQEARCRAAPACGVPIEPPYHTSGTAADACVRFYDVACLHGLAVPDPGAVAVNACVAAIRGAAAGDGGSCPIVADPTTSPACAWMATGSNMSDAASAASTDGD